MYGNLAHDKLVSSKDWREKINIHSHRYVIEDIKEGLAFIYSLAERLNIKAPITSSLLDITSTILGLILKKMEETLNNLRINYSLNKLKKILSDTKMNIIIIGCGRMGLGIAITFALAGYKIKPLDIKKRSNNNFTNLLIKSNAEISKNLKILNKIKLINKNKIKITSNIETIQYRSNENIIKSADIIFLNVFQKNLILKKMYSNY